MTWTIHLPIDLPSANRNNGGAATNSRHRAAGAIYRRQRATYVTALVAMMREVGAPSVNNLIDALDCPVRHVEIVRLWARGCRAWDDDNMVAACKGLRDAMQRARTMTRKGKVPTLVPGAGLVWDDSARWARFEYGQRRAEDGRPGVEVTITDGAAP